MQASPHIPQHPQAESLAKAVFNSELKQHVTAALNRTLFLEIHWTVIQEDTTELIAEIQAELAN